MYVDLVSWVEKNKEFGMRNPSGFGLFLDENNIVKLRIDCATCVEIVIRITWIIGIIGIT